MKKEMKDLLTKYLDNVDEITEQVSSHDESQILLKFRWYSANPKYK
jgi:hypothetical protein